MGIGGVCDSYGKDPPDSGAPQGMSPLLDFGRSNLRATQPAESEGGENDAACPPAFFQPSRQYEETDFRSVAPG